MGTIKQDFQTGETTNATVGERFGLGLMRFGLTLTRPMDYVGFSYGCRIVRQVFSSQRNVEIEIAPDFSFRFPYGDVYWSTLLDKQHLYAADVLNFLKSVQDIDYSFIDCGANFGFMSCAISSSAWGAKPVIAIEASPDTFASLKENASLADDRFECLNRAIYSQSGETVEIYGAKHEALSILEEGGASTGQQVETLAISDLLPWHQKTNASACVLKLDIEGVEEAAMKGAGDLLDRDCLVIYEDHGNDQMHTVSRFMREQVGLSIYACDLNSAVEITSDEMLANIKKNRRVGYDFFATNSPLWLERLKGYRQAG